MINKNTEPAKLVISNKDGLIDKEHFGYVVRGDKIHITEKIGEDKNYPFYMYSCQKPLQAALIIDYELDQKYNLTDEEIAICTTSHANEKVHIDIIKRILDKFEISPSRLKCENREPNTTALHNNCSGAHAMMLGLCKLNDWDMDSYDNINNPLQKQIRKKINELCETKTDYPITKDSCKFPIYSMPLENIAKGYLNLFCNPKYEKIKNAFLNNPHIIGGKNKTDTKIMEQSKKLISKIDTNGLSVVVNPEIEEAFVVKICDADKTALEFVTIDLINNLHWAEIETLRDDTACETVTLL